MKRYSLIFSFLFSCICLYAQTRISAVSEDPKVVAHRGFWDTEGSAQNSLMSLDKAAEIYCYGSEFDVNITEDGYLVVNHDATINGMVIEEHPYKDIADVKLKNGETLPTLYQYLQRAKDWPEIRLILEIKTHKLPENEDKAVDGVVTLVKNMGLLDRTEFISFSLEVCKRLHKQLPESKVAYLNGDLSPMEVKKLGLTGIDYHYDVFNKHPEWLDEAYQNGIEVNVWTVDKLDLLQKFSNDSRVNLITTNKPLALQGLKNKK